MAILTDRRGRAGVAALFATVLVIGGTAGSPANAKHGDLSAAGAFTQRNLVSDIPGRAELLDPVVKNPWGIAFGPTTPVWVNNQFSPVTAKAVTLYSGARTPTDPVVKVPLEVGATSPFGLVFNPTTDFKITQNGVLTPARFLFTEQFFSGNQPQGRITGWSNVPAPAATTTSTDARKAPSVPFGLALVRGQGDLGNRLLVADGLSGTIDVYDANFQRVDDPSLFVDPNITESDLLLPYNVAFLKGKVYVAYAHGPGDPGGAISRFSASGEFEKRLVTDDHLAGPWGMVIAPQNWGQFGTNLLVGNVDDGTIQAFARGSGKFMGTLQDASGAPLVNTGLWGLAFGNGVIGNPNSLIFAAGIGDEVGEHVYEHGLVGLIEPAG